QRPLCGREIGRGPLQFRALAGQLAAGRLERVTWCAGALAVGNGSADLVTLSLELGDLGAQLVEAAADKAEAFFVERAPLLGCALLLAQIAQAGIGLLHFTAQASGLNTDGTEARLELVGSGAGGGKLGVALVVGGAGGDEGFLARAPLRAVPGVE